VEDTAIVLEEVADKVAGSTSASSPIQLDEPASMRRTDRATSWWHRAAVGQPRDRQWEVPSTVGDGGSAGALQARGLLVWGWRTRKFTASGDQMRSPAGRHQPTGAGVKVRDTGTGHIPDAVARMIGKRRPASRHTDPPQAYRPRWQIVSGGDMNGLGGLLTVTGRTGWHTAEDPIPKPVMEQSGSVQPAVAERSAFERRSAQGFKDPS